MTRPTYAIRLLRDALRLERKWLKANVACSHKGNVRILRRRIAHLEAAIATLELKP